MDFTLNGKSISVHAEQGESLLALLRDTCGITSAKDGCAPEGSCGACTVDLTYATSSDGGRTWRQARVTP